MLHEDVSCVPSTSTATPSYPQDDKGRLLDLDGRHQGNSLQPNQMMQPLPPLETLSHGSSPSALPMDPNGFKINRWQNRNFDSGVQTMVSSSEQSLMSIHPSEISVMSGMTDDVTRQDLTDAQRCRFERLSIAPSSSYAGSGLPELVELMRDEDEAVVYKAVYMMQNIAKMDADFQQHRERIITGSAVASALREVLERRGNQTNIVRVALGTLFHLCNHPDGTRDVVELVGNEPTLLTHLIKHMRTAAHSSYKYAILSLHSILSDRSSLALSSAAVAEARQRDALTPAVEVLRTDQSEKLLPIIVDLIKILCEGPRGNEQKNRFIELGGVVKLLEILNKCNYENLLWRTTKLLLVFANFSPDSLIASSAPSVLHSRLSHGSTRLVQCLLECLRAISDKASPPGVDATPVLNSILLLFGTSNPFISRYCVQIISNMIANHKRNKEFVASKSIVPTLMNLLHESTLWNGTDKDKEDSEEMQEAILGCLHHLCVRHGYSTEVCLHLMSGNGYSVLLLDRLYNMRPAVLRWTLLILVQTAPLDQNLQFFRSTNLTSREEIPLTFVHQVVIILRVAFHQFPNAQQGVPLKVENVKVVELVSSTLTILASLARDRRLLEEIVFHFLQNVNTFFGDKRVFLPLFGLEQPFLQDDSMTYPNLSLLLALASPPSHPQIFSILSSSPGLYQVLQNNARRPEQHIASTAHSLLTILFNQPSTSHDRLHSQYDVYAPQPSSSSYGVYPMASSYPPPSHSHHSLHPHSLPVTVLPPSVPSSSRLQPSPEETHNLSGRSDQSAGDGPWPEDLPLEGDPFAQVFCSPASPVPPSELDVYTPPSNQYPPPHQHLPYPDPYSNHHNNY